MFDHTKLRRDSARIREPINLKLIHCCLQVVAADRHVGSCHCGGVRFSVNHEITEPINWHRTALHELGHWSGHGSRLARNQRGRFGSADYAREELIAEMTSAFACASLSIQPTVRHADYIGSWLTILREDDKAIFRAASAASKAADYLLAFAPEAV